MFNGRMLNIIRYLQIPRPGLLQGGGKGFERLRAERALRCGPRSTIYLSLERLPEIEKHSKGVLVYPEHLDLKGMEDGNEVIYTGKERMSILLLILMIRNEDLKINQLSEQFRVSRSTVKNDMAALDEELKKDGMGIGYSGHFYLAGPKIKRATLLNQEFRKYIEYLINPFTSYNSYEFYCIHIIHKAFEGVSVANVVMAVDGSAGGASVHPDQQLLPVVHVERGGSGLVSFSTARTIPWTSPWRPDYRPGGLSGDSEKRLEETIGRKACLRRTYRNDGEDVRLSPTRSRAVTAEVDPVQAEAVTFSLISAMSKRMNMPFDKDTDAGGGTAEPHDPPDSGASTTMWISSDNVRSLLRPQEPPDVLSLVAQVLRGDRHP